MDSAPKKRSKLLSRFVAIITGALLCVCVVWIWRETPTKPSESPTANSQSGTRTPWELNLTNHAVLSMTHLMVSNLVATQLKAAPSEPRIYIKGRPVSEAEPFRISPTDANGVGVSLIQTRATSD